MCDIPIVIEIVGQFQPCQIRQGRMEDLWDRHGVPRGFRKKPSADVGETEISLPGDDMVCQAHNLLILRLMADLGTAQDDHEVGTKPLQDGDQFGRETDIPDVDAQPQDPRVAPENGFRDLADGLVDIELHQ